jgi:predicted house-cleaning noncanonical NTP pyrophosphatase (MazG superfamily)
MLSQQIREARPNFNGLDQARLNALGLSERSAILAPVVDDPANVQVRRLVDEALETFDSPDVTTSALVRKAQRIAGLRRDYAKQLAFILQMTDLASEVEDKHREALPIFLQVRAQLATLVGAAEEILETERQYENVQRTRRIKGGKFSGLSVSQLEDNLRAMERAYDDAQPPAGLTPIDAAFAAERATKTRADLLPDLQWTRGTLGKIRQDVHNYLVSVEADLLAGKVNSDIFQRAQLYINEALRKYAPDALTKFVASQESLSSGTPEDYAHALASSRRLIKALADALYPASGQDVVGIDGTPRSMSDDKYKNRLTEYVRENVEGKRHRQIVVQLVSELSNRLNALDGLASKGVHDEVTQAEAETCVVWTYMLAGDIVRIADGTSALLRATGADKATD